MTVKISSNIKAKKVAIRLFRGKELVVYASTSLGNLKNVDGGFEIQLVREFDGCRYEVKSVGKPELVLVGTLKYDEKLKSLKAVPGKLPNKNELGE